METKWTKGPWEYVVAPSLDGGPDVYNVQAADDIICGWWTLGDKPAERIANASLMAASPDLYEALDEVMALLRKEAPGTPLNNHRFDALGMKAHAALAKARGELS